MPSTTSVVVTGVVSSVSIVPSRRSSARLFIVSSGTMNSTGNQKNWKNTIAGESSCGALLYCSRMPVKMKPMNARNAIATM